MNITLSVDENKARRAREVAHASGTSLNQMIRDYIDQFAGEDRLDSDLAELRALAGVGDSGGRQRDAI